MSRETPRALHHAEKSFLFGVRPPFHRTVFQSGNRAGPSQRWLFVFSRKGRFAIPMESGPKKASDKAGARFVASFRYPRLNFFGRSSFWWKRKPFLSSNELKAQRFDLLSSDTNTPSGISQQMPVRKPRNSLLKRLCCLQQQFPRTAAGAGVRPTAIPQLPDANLLPPFQSERESRESAASFPFTFQAFPPVRSLSLWVGLLCLGGCCGAAPAQQTAWLPAQAQDVLRQLGGLGQIPADGWKIHIGNLPHGEDPELTTRMARGHPAECKHLEEA